MKAFQKELYSRPGLSVEAPFPCICAIPKGFFWRHDLLGLISRNHIIKYYKYTHVFHAAAQARRISWISTSWVCKVAAWVPCRLRYQRKAAVAPKSMRLRATILRNGQGVDFDGSDGFGSLGLGLESLPWSSGGGTSMKEVEVFVVKGRGISAISGGSRGSVASQSISSSKGSLCTPRRPKQAPVYDLTSSVVLQTLLSTTSRISMA